MTRSLLALGAACFLLLAACADGDDATASTAEVSTTDDSTGDSTIGDDDPTTTEDDGDDPADRPEPAACQDRATGVQAFTTEAGGPTTDVRVLVPSDAGDQPLPVVLNWHGLGSSGLQQQELTAYDDLAEAEGFIAVHPTGADNAWELAQFDAPDRDDLVMVDDIIDRLVTEFCADPLRIYSTGMSNGGFFTALLVCQRADRIAAAVSVAGVSHPDDCQPSRPVPFAAYHGTDDDIVRFDGGRSSLEDESSTDDSRSFFEQSMPGEFAQFAASFGCAEEPESVPVGDEVIRRDYVGCDDDVPLSFYEIAEGGHTWPGSPLGPLLTSTLGRTTDQVDATADGWAFLSRFALPEDG